jgi:formylglycine-generating enzyme required for sulfatase activity/energy-coupling factor transporter ATP-binding protein EcfA2
MTDTPDDIQRKIEELEALRPSLGDAAVDAAIAALRAQAAPSMGDTLNAQGSQGTLNRPAGSVDQTFGNAPTSGDNSGIAIGVNSGTVQQFFGAEPPVDGEKLLAAYLTSLTSECQELRLGRLTGKHQSGAEQSATPQLRLQAVYTSLVTNGSLMVLEEHTDTVKKLRALLEQRDIAAMTPDHVPPSESRVLITEDKAHELDRHFSWRIMALAQLQTLQQLEQDRQLTIQIVRPELTTEAIRQNRRLVLLGEPGAGKSTVLRYLALLLAQKAQGQPVDLPGWTGDYMPVPILCPLGAVAEVLRTEQPDPDKALWQAIGDVLHGDLGTRSGLRTHLHDAITAGGVLLLFDGLDELPTSGDNPRERIAHAIRRFAIGEGAQTPIVVTCRVLPYQAAGDWKLPDDEGWEVRTVQPLAFGQVRQFVQRWYAEVSLIDPDLSAEAAEGRSQQLVAALVESDRLQKLVASPLLLTMLAILHYNRDEIPRDRVKLYEECVLLLLDRWEPVRTPAIKRPGLLERLGNLPNLELDMLRGILHRLAWQVQAEPPEADGRGLLDGIRLEGELHRFFSKRYKEYDPSAKVETFIQVLNEDAGLLQARSDDRYAFPHLTFQEYLAACALADSDNLVADAYAVWTSDDASRWREVLLLMAGRLRLLGERPAQREGIPWLRHLLRAKLKGTAKTARQRAQDAALAVLSYQELGEQEVLDEEDLNDLLREGITDLLTTPDSGVVQEDRITAARVLADLTDPRYPVSLDEWRQETARRNETFGAPDGYWCYVRPCTYQIGGWDEDENEDEQPPPAADIDLPGFWMARYPITVAQYRVFIDDGGYQQQGYWTSEGWKWRQEHDRTQPYRWGEARYNNPNQAVIGVTWYECMAFCNWLTAQLADRLPEGYVVQLPTEAEWEAAAAYDTQMERRTYPWGEDEPTPEYAIFTDDQGNRLGAPAPVGVCPAGSAACGALDMGGQMWEWCRSSHKAYPAGANEGEQEFKRDEYDVPLRGGSWRNNRTSVRCAARGRNNPDLRGGSLNNGLRVLLSPRVPSHSR